MVKKEVKSDYVLTDIVTQKLKMTQKAIVYHTVLSAKPVNMLKNER